MNVTNERDDNERLCLVLLKQQRLLDFPASFKTQSSKVMSPVASPERVLYFLSG